MNLHAQGMWEVLTFKGARRAKTHIKSIYGCLLELRRSDHCNGLRPNAEKSGEEEEEEKKRGGREAAQ